MTQRLGEGVGPRIAKYRRMNGWTAQELADRVGNGLSRSVLANIENGRRDDVGIKQFVAICAALEVPPAALLLDLDRPLEMTTLELTRTVNVDYGDEGMRPESHPMPLNVTEAIEWLSGTDDAPSVDLPPSRQHVRNLLRELTAARSAEEEVTAMVRMFHEHAISDDSDSRALAESFMQQARAAERNMLAAYDRLRSMGVDVPDLRNLKKPFAELFRESLSRESEDVRPESVLTDRRD